MSVTDRNHPIHTGTDGDYWRILLAGEYEVRAFKEGYEPLSKRVTIVDGPATVLNFTLKKSASEEGSGRSTAHAQSPQPTTQQQAIDQQGVNSQVLQHKLQNLLQTSEPALPLLSPLAPLTNENNNVNQLLGNGFDYNDMSQAAQSPYGFNSISMPSEYGMSEGDSSQLEHRLSPEKKLLDNLAMASPFEQMNGPPKATSFYDDIQQLYDDHPVNRDNFFEKKFDSDSDEAH